MHHLLTASCCDGTVYGSGQGCGCVFPGSRSTCSMASSLSTPVSSLTFLMFFRVSPHRSSNNRSIATPRLIAVSRLRAARSHNGHCGHAQRKTVNPTEKQHAESSESKNPTEILSARVQKNREPRTKNHHREPHWVTTTRSTGISAGRDRPGLFGSHSLRAPDPRYYILGLCAPIWPVFWSSINPPSFILTPLPGIRRIHLPPSAEKCVFFYPFPFTFSLPSVIPNPWTPLQPRSEPAEPVSGNSRWRSSSRANLLFSGGGQPDGNWRLSFACDRNTGHSARNDPEMRPDRKSSPRAQHEHGSWFEFVLAMQSIPLVLRPRSLAGPNGGLLGPAAHPYRLQGKRGACAPYSSAAERSKKKR